MQAARTILVTLGSRAARGLREGHRAGGTARHHRPAARAGGLDDPASHHGRSSTTLPAATTTTTTTARPATTTTTRPLTKAEATSRLCKAVEAADAAIQQGKLVPGGLKLSSGIDTYEKTADPDAYVEGRQAASTACARAGFPIQLGGPVQCVPAPCP